MNLALLLRKAKNAAPSKMKGAQTVPPGSLRITQPNDSLEREADRVADEVMSNGAPVRSGQTLSGLSLQRKCSCGGSGGANEECEKCRKEAAGVQRKSRTGDTTPDTAPPMVAEVLRSPGDSLDHETRLFMERRFNYDFSSVRIHTDAQAAESAHAVDAHAYTVGQHIAFAPGRYTPHTAEGQRLVAHELAHTIQQRQMSPHVARQGSGRQREVAGPVVDEPKEDPFKGVGVSTEQRNRGSTWGWGAPETNNVYQECVVAPLEREKFKAFYRSLPRQQTWDEISHPTPKKFSASHPLTQEMPRRPQSRPIPCRRTERQSTN